MVDEGRDLTKFRELAVRGKSFDTFVLRRGNLPRSIGDYCGTRKKLGDDAQQLLQRGYSAVAR